MGYCLNYQMNSFPLHIPVTKNDDENVKLIFRTCHKTEIIKKCTY